MVLQNMTMPFVLKNQIGKLNKVRNGGWYGAPPPYGYEIVDGKLSIHPEEE